MSFWDYLKDRAGIVIAVLVPTVVIVLCIAALGEVSLGFLMAFIVLFCFSIAIAADFIKRRRFYSDLLSTLELLDPKTLIGSVMGESDFAEAKILREVLLQCNKEQNDLIAAVQRDSEDYREYIETWAHEIKTPLASTRLILENHPGAVSGDIARELDRVDFLLEQTLFYARSAQTHKDYIIRKTSLKTLVNSVIRRNSHAFIENKIAVEPLREDVEAYTDVKWMEFILNQIVNNAIKYKRDSDPRICFSTERHENSIYLKIADNGIGIPASDLPRIFDKGFTGQTGRKYGKSTGIGLYLCRKLCRKLGVGIAAQSQEGQGTELTIEFPISEMAALVKSDKTVS